MGDPCTDMPCDQNAVPGWEGEAHEHGLLPDGSGDPRSRAEATTARPEAAGSRPAVAVPGDPSQRADA